MINAIKRFFSRKKVSSDSHISALVKKHADVLQSLKEYDEGKKEISTADLERRFKGL